MKTRRRDVLLGVTAVAAADSLPAPAIAQGTKELKLVTDWPISKEFPGHAASTERLAQSIAAMSEGHFKITVYPPGSLVRGFETFDAVSASVADMYHTDEVYFQDRSPALNFSRRCPMV